MKKNLETLIHLQIFSSFKTNGDYSIFAHIPVFLNNNLNQRKNNHFQWMSVITHNFSRIFSHQYIRHTWLNFNQRSHRYTKVDRYVLLEEFNKEDKKYYLECNKLYQKLI